MSACNTCPFKGGDEAEQGISLGCLPSVFEIMQIKRETGHNWGCHSEDRICAGFVEACRETGLEYKGAPLLKYEDWYRNGVPAIEGMVA